jgi:hypothetical protein
MPDTRTTITLTHLSASPTRDFAHSPFNVGARKGLMRLAIGGSMTVVARDRVFGMTIGRRQT